MISLEKQYNTRTGAPVRLSHMDTTRAYPIQGMYWDSEYREWKTGEWTVSGEFDTELLCAEDLIEVQNA
jgi:hypothetical protein